MLRIIRVLVALAAVWSGSVGSARAEGTGAAGEIGLLAKGGGSGRGGDDGFGSGRGRGRGSDDLFDDSRRGHHLVPQIFFVEGGLHHHGDGLVQHHHGDGNVEHTHLPGKIEIEIEDHGGRGGR